MKRIASLTLIGVIAVAGCSKKTATLADNRPAIKVQTLEVQPARLPDITAIAGTVRAKVSATIAAKVIATIREIPVHVGDTVAAGQLLAQLDDRDLRAEFEKAKADFDRYQKLLGNQAVTPAEFEAMQSRYRVATAALSDTTIAAPFAGIIVEKFVSAGDMATAGKPLFVIEQPADYRLEANVPERWTGNLTVGQALPVIIAATGETCEGRIGEIVPASDPVSRSVLVKIDLPCQQALKSGQFGHVQLPVGERTALLVPARAVHERGQLTFVFIADAGKAQMRLVRAGKTVRNAVEILAGVQAGERVILTGDVADGQPVSQ